MRYYISDCHFFHKSLNERMDNRGFDSAEAMNEYMIEKWNKKVRKNDEVIILGDLSVARAEETEKIIRRLNGRKTLIVGNHDKYLKDKAFDRGLFQKIVPYLELHDNKRKVILSHYPVFCYNGQNRILEDGSPVAYMLYGHVHNTLDEELIRQFVKITKSHKREIRGKEISIPCEMINCFCMKSDYEPLTLDEWIELEQKENLYDL